MDKYKIEDKIFSELCYKQINGLKKVWGVEGDVFKPISGEFKKVIVEENRADFVFEVDETKIVHFEFQTTNYKKDLFRFLYYDQLIAQTYGLPIETYVIYTNSILDVPTILDFNVFSYTPNVIYMTKYKAEDVLTEIEGKLKSGVKLTEKDIANLSMTPIMGANKPKEYIVNRALELSSDIQDKKSKDNCQEIIFALTIKFNIELNEELEVRLKMSPIGNKLINEGIEKGKLDAAKNLLDILNDDEIASRMGLELEVVKKLRRDLVK